MVQARTRSNLADFPRLSGRVTDARPLARQPLQNLRKQLPRNHRYLRWVRSLFRKVRTTAAPGFLQPGSASQNKAP